MKKFLAIILCAALVIGMIPAAFATTTGETGTLEYVFSSEAVGGTGTVTPDAATHTYEAIKTDVSPNKWAFVVAYAYKNRRTANLYPGGFAYSLISNYCTEVPNGAMMLKIEVPEGADGTYIPEVSYFDNPNGGKMSAYIVPESAAGSDWTTIPVNAISDYKNNPSATSVIKIVDAVNTYDDNGVAVGDYDAQKIKTASVNQPLKLTAGDYYLVFSITGYADDAPVANSHYYIYPRSLKLVPAKPDKTHTFNIDTNAMTDEATALARTAGSANKFAGLVGSLLRSGTGLQFVNELSEIDAADSNRWAVRYKAPAADGTASEQDTAGLQIEGRGSCASTQYNVTRAGRDLAEARLALLLEISYAGKYKLTVNGKNDTYGTAADVYMIPEKDVVANGDSITQAFIRKYTPVGRIDQEGTAGVASYDVGAVELEKGNYYIVFLFNSDNVTLDNSGRHWFWLSSIVLTEDESEDVVITPDEMTQNELSFAVNANVAGAEVTADIAEYTQGSVADVSRGTIIHLEAKPLDGYEFAGWKRGGVALDARGIYLDTDASFDYKIMTNTYLTAVYVEKKATTEGTKAVEFWNEYGTFFARNEEKDGFISVPDASLTGHIFDAWYADGTEKITVTGNGIDISLLSNTLTRAMAKYSGTTAVSGYAVANGNTKDYNATRSFGDPVTGEDENATCWRRDGKIVAYDVDTYTHYIWDATQIISSYEPIADKTPIVVLEDTAIDGARMIEYDRGDTSKYEICEVGILFGSQDDMVISSCEHKATSQKNSNHGQFSAAPLDEDHTYARGYMIYKNVNTGVYHVIYAD